MDFSSLDYTSEDNLKKLDGFLSSNSFLTEKSFPSEVDESVMKKLASCSIQVLQRHPQIFRWSKTVLQSVRASSSCCPGEAVKQVDLHNRPKKPTEQVAKKPLPKNGAPRAAYLDERLKIWDEVRAKHNQEMERKQKEESKDITITLPDGKEIPGKSWITTPHDIAHGIAPGLARSSVVAKLDGKILWDMTRPLEESHKIEFLKFENDEAREVFWHSSAHVIGEAMESFLGGKLVFGPPVENGFYYDIDSEFSVSDKDFGAIEKVVQKIVKENQPFERLMISKEDLLRMFDYNPYKKKVLNEKVTTAYTSVYRCGDLIDLCRGPHLPSTGKIKAFKCLRTSSAYFEGKADQESLTRLYGISFPDKKLLKEWEKFQAQAKERDHRKIGKDQELFFFDQASPGSCFWYPKGTYINNQLTTLMRQEYRKRGYQEVITPNMYDVDIWKTSGHWQNYEENMFSFEVEKKKFALKPMNCPGHCVLFGSRNRSFRELPLRIADFGALHRNELSGALSGLTRVRRFQQDDAHIFCTTEQIETEISKVIDFLTHIIVDTFGMKYKLFLSTRPESYLGDLSIWEKTEAQLEKALKDYGADFDIDEGGGAFYGPKIDIKVTDAMRRQHQTATIQLDFNLPERFKLKYIDSDGSEKRPVMIHRAILGSIERSMGVLTEHFGGKWPLWLSPRQVKIITVSDKFLDYAIEIKDIMYARGIEAEVEMDSGLTLNKKIRNAQVEQFNFQCIIGQTEMENRSLNVRTRDNKQHGEHKADFVIDRLAKLRENRVINAEEVFIEEKQ